MSLSTLSDNLLYIAILAYLGAMLLHTADYSLMRRRTPVAAPAEAKVLVGAGGPDVAVPVDGSPSENAAPRRDWAPLFGKLAVWITGLAVLLHFTTAATRGLAAHRMPWGN
ncbi:MAG: c-type cytochrome biogenesis protein CcsB, partial [Catenulispora sp.]|nr:c-type cytochrome biogenesis protein CcsB [Catenulispora sp.]